MSKRNRAALVRALAARHRESFALGAALGKQFTESQSAVAYQRLSRRFKPKRLMAIVDDPDHPDRPNAVAAELTGNASFLALIYDCTEVEYDNRDFLAGFIAGFDGELLSIDTESRAMHRQRLQDERDLRDNYIRSLQKPDSYESLVSGGRFSGN